MCDVHIYSAILCATCDYCITIIKSMELLLDSHNFVKNFPKCQKL